MMRNDACTRRANVNLHRKPGTMFNTMPTQNRESSRPFSCALETARFRTDPGSNEEVGGRERKSCPKTGFRLHSSKNVWLRFAWAVLELFFRDGCETGTSFIAASFKG